jgi:hypothetical protein
MNFLDANQHYVPLSYIVTQLMDLFCLNGENCVNNHYARITMREKASISNEMKARKHNMEQKFMVANFLWMGEQHLG